MYTGICNAGRYAGILVDMTKLVHVKIPSDLLTALDAYCERVGANRSGVVRKGIQMLIGDTGIPEDREASPDWKSKARHRIAVKKAEPKPKPTTQVVEDDDIPPISAGRAREKK